jgi:putative motility protein YjfB-like
MDLEEGGSAMDMSSVNPAIDYVMQAPALFKQQATAVAVAMTVARKALDQQQGAAQEILQMIAPNAGQNFDVTV